MRIMLQVGNVEDGLFVAESDEEFEAAKAYAKNMQESAAAFFAQYGLQK